MEIKIISIGLEERMQRAYGRNMWERDRSNMDEGPTGAFWQPHSAHGHADSGEK